MGKWKPVPLDNDSIIEGIDGLIGIEVYEPDDTNIIKDKAGLKRKLVEKEVTNKVSLSRKKQKTKKLKNKVEKIKKCGNVEKEVLDKTDNLFVDEMVEWRKYGLQREILKALHDKGFYMPTKIQEKCILAAMTAKKSDIVGAAETGSGKTLAFGIPMVHQILAEKKNSEEKLFAVVMTPTRELAVQVKEHLSFLCKYTDINVALVVGGLAKEKQERLLKKRPEIVVGTPGRIWELFNEGNSHLREIPKIRLLVVDEADRMLEQKHFEELGQLLDRMNVNPEFRESRRNFVFSATLTFVHDPPNYHKGKKKKRPKQKLNNLLGQIGVKNEIVYDLSAEKLTPASLTEWKIQCQLTEKDYYLVYFLHYNPGRAIIFCNSIGCVKRLANLLNILKFKPLPLHANMEQKQRLKNLEKFRDASNGLLLATDVAARGLDIPSVGHVVHYQVPRTAETYVHRSGRTARQAQTGASLLLVSIEETRLYHKLMKSLKRATGVDDLDTSVSDLDQIKKIVHLARDIDQAGLALRRSSSNEKWYEKAARDMDIVLDDDELPEKTTEFAVKKMKKELTGKEKELNRLLDTWTAPRNFPGKFPDLNVLKTKKMKKKK